MLYICDLATASISASADFGTQGRHRASSSQPALFGLESRAAATALDVWRFAARQ